MGLLIDIDMIPIPALLVTLPTGVVSAANRVALVDWRLNPAALAQRSARELVHPTAPSDNAVFESLLLAGPGDRMQWKAETPLNDGRRRHFDVMGQVLSEDLPNTALLVASDITEEREHSERLAVDAQRLRALIEANFDVYYDWRVDGEFHEWSPQMNALLSLPVGESFPQRVDAWAERIHPDEREMVLFRLHRSVERAEPYVDEYRLRDQHGEYRLISDRSFVLIDDTGNVTHQVGVMRDITNERQAQIALEESASYYEALFTAATNPTLRTDSLGTILDVNSAAIEMFATDHNGPCGELIADYLGEPADVALNLLRETPQSDREALTIETTTAVRNERRTLRFATIPCVVSDVTTYFWVGTDITDVRSSTEALMSSRDSLRQRAQALQEQVKAVRCLVDQERLTHAESMRALRANVETLVEPMLDRLARLISERSETAYVSAAKETLHDLLDCGTSGHDFLDTGSRPLTKALTRREQEIAELIRLGRTSDEIAELLHLSPSTVAFHRQSIRRKLGLEGARVRLDTVLLRGSAEAADRSERRPDPEPRSQHR